RLPRHNHRREPSPSAIAESRLDALVANDTPRVCEACADVFRLEPRIPFEDCVRSIAGCQHPQHVLDGKTTAANDRLATEDLGIDRDALEEGVFTGGRVAVLRHGPCC